RLGSPGGVPDGFRQGAFSGAVADDAAPSPTGREAAVEFAVTFGRPAFGKPAAAGTEHEIFADAARPQHLADACFRCRRNPQRKECAAVRAREGGADAECGGECEILVDAMAVERRDAQVVEDRSGTLARRCPVESHAPGRPGKP